MPFQLCRTFTHSDAEFSLCQRAISSTLAHISAIPSGRWINQRTECPRFARTSARRSRQRKMDEREAREDVEEEAAIPSSSRRMLPCLRVSLPHSRTAAASSASHALWPWQCYRHNRASVFVRMCKKCHVACVCRFRGWGLSVFSQDVSMYCKLYQSSKKTICEARGFPRTRLSIHMRRCPGDISPQKYRTIAIPQIFGETERCIDLLYTLGDRAALMQQKLSWKLFRVQIIVPQRVKTGESIAESTTSRGLAVVLFPTA